MSLVEAIANHIYLPAKWRKHSQLVHYLFGINHTTSSAVHRGEIALKTMLKIVTCYFGRSSVGGSCYSWRRWYSSRGFHFFAIFFLDQLWIPCEIDWIKISLVSHLTSTYAVHVMANVWTEIDITFGFRSFSAGTSSFAAKAPWAWLEFLWWQRLHSQYLEFHIYHSECQCWFNLSLYLC